MMIIKELNTTLDIVTRYIPQQGYGSATRIGFNRLFYYYEYLIYIIAEKQCNVCIYGFSRSLHNNVDKFFQLIMNCSNISSNDKDFIQDQYDLYRVLLGNRIESDYIKLNSSYDKTDFDEFLEFKKRVKVELKPMAEILKKYKPIIQRDVNNCSNFRTSNVVYFKRNVM